MDKHLTQHSTNLAGTVQLPASKSISNRLLIMNALSKKPVKLENLSQANDTLILERILNQIKNQADLQSPCILDAEDSGTTFRFLTALLSVTEGNWVLTGTERMQQRPIKPLVDALLQAGAYIEYAKEEGFPPLKIKGKKLQGGTITIDTNISSQFVSAIMMVAPLMEQGLELILTGKQVSKPYAQLTAILMKNWGIQINETTNIIRIAPQTYQPKPVTIEADWSGASYFYALVALAQKADIVLVGLQKDSLQGDSVLPSIFKHLGVKTDFVSTGIRLRKIPVLTKEFHYNFMNAPDLAQTLAVVCAGLQIPAMLTGLDNLALKETNRLTALEAELNKIGVNTQSTANCICMFQANINIKQAIETYNDHRMAMAFAPLIMKVPQLTINNTEVIKKSFPSFWERLAEIQVN